MAGPDYTATGGGANYLCLPDDPQYNLKKQTAIGCAYLDEGSLVSVHL